MRGVCPHLSHLSKIRILKQLSCTETQLDPWEQTNWTHFTTPFTQRALDGWRMCFLTNATQPMEFQDNSLHHIHELLAWEICLRFSPSNFGSTLMALLHRDLKPENRSEVEKNLAEKQTC